MTNPTTVSTERPWVAALLSALLAGRSQRGRCSARRVPRAVAAILFVLGSLHVYWSLGRRGVPARVWPQVSGKGPRTAPRAGGTPKSLYHLAVLLEWSEIRLPGGMGLLEPVFRLLAKRARRKGIDRELEAEYCR